METYAGVDEFAQFSNTLSAYKQFNKEKPQLNFPLYFFPSTSTAFRKAWSVRR